MHQSANPGSQQLEELASQAMRLEPINPAAAAMVWRQVLDLLPPESAEFQQINQRIGALIGGWSSASSAAAGPSIQTWSPGVQEISARNRSQRQVRPPDPLPLAITKTVGSMAVTILVYYFLVFPSLTIAVGFVVLMLIHEMGHVLAMRYYGLSASPPIFIPFVGALINLRQQPPNALVESVVGIGGPVLGTVGAVVCYAIAMSLQVDSDLQMQLLMVAQLAFFLNLFNLLPVPPLDGGRVTAAISPWLWIGGLAGLFTLMFVEARASGFGALIIPVLILVYAFPRIRTTLQMRGTNDPYYNVSRAASWTMGTIYLGLGTFLTFMFLHLHGLSFLHEIGF